MKKQARVETIPPISTETATNHYKRNSRTKMFHELLRSPTENLLEHISSYIISNIFRVNLEGTLQQLTKMSTSCIPRNQQSIFPSSP